ncbi:hypothetical protein DFH09DRAFT_1087486 [Mycena vulgaris]|nr:hypothetical protein DFH09DRAFT_1087486 [Mycena vulgaris]
MDVFMGEARHSAAQNSTPYNSPITSTSGMTTPTTRVQRRKREDGPWSLRASRSLSVVKPTSHEAPADESTPPPPTKKRKSPDLHEEGIRKRPRTRCSAEVRLSSSPVFLFRLGGHIRLVCLRRLRCERGARALANTLPGTPQRITPAPPSPLATSLHRVASVAMCDGYYFLVL